MSFSEQEKEIAKTIPQQVYNYYGSTNVINGSAETIQANAGNSVTASFDYELVKNTVNEIEESIHKSEEISQDDKEEAFELLTEIKDKVEKKRSNAIIKAALVGLKDYLINVGAGLTVALIQSKFQGLF